MQSSSFSRQIVSALLLLLTSLIWGSTFVAQSVGSDSVGAFTFVASRSFIAGAALLPVIALRGRRAGSGEKTVPQGGKTLWLGGILCGTALTVASVLQQVGVAETTVGKAGFITALYIVIVPLCGIFLRKRIPWFLWIGVGLAVLGMYFLCITESFSVARGDLLVLLCAIVFSCHILIIDHFSPRVDGVKMSCVQFFTAGVLSLPFMLFLERPTAADLSAALLPILYAGLLSSAVGYTLQIVAQKNLQPTVASLIMSLESVFSALSGWLFLHQGLSSREFFGCCLVFAAVILAQLPADLLKKKKSVPAADSAENGSVSSEICKK